MYAPVSSKVGGGRRAGAETCRSISLGTMAIGGGTGGGVPAVAGPELVDGRTPMSVDEGFIATV